MYVKIPKIILANQSFYIRISIDNCMRETFFKCLTPIKSQLGEIIYGLIKGQLISKADLKVFI